MSEIGPRACRFTPVVLRSLDDLDGISTDLELAAGNVVAGHARQAHQAGILPCTLCQMPGKKSQPTHSTAVARRLKDAAKDPSFRPADLLGDGKDLLSKVRTRDPSQPSPAPSRLPQHTVCSACSPECLMCLPGLACRPRISRDSSAGSGTEQMATRPRQNGR